MKKELEHVVEVAVAGGQEPVSIYALNDGYGRYGLAPLLAAKAQVLSGMAALKAAEVASKGKR